MITEGYYKTCEQFWFEDEDSKTGWTGSGWGDVKDFELVEYLEEDKYGNPTMALFKYEGGVFLGIQNAAYNIQARFLSEYVEIARNNVGKSLEEAFKENPEFKKLSDSIDMVEKYFEIKKYLNL